MIWCRLNPNLLLKFLNKLKVFLKSDGDENMRRQAISCIFESLLKFSQSDREATHQIYSQVVDFLHFMWSQFCFDPSVANEVTWLFDFSYISDDKIFFSQRGNCSTKWHKYLSS